MNEPRDILFTPNGHLLVAGAFNDDIKRYDKNGAYLGNFTSGGAPDEPQGMAWGPDGNLYVAAGNSRRIEVYNGTTGAWLRGFTVGRDPAGLAFGLNGLLYVSRVEGGSPEIVVVDPFGGTALDSFGGPGNPRGIAFGPDGNLYGACESASYEWITRIDRVTHRFIDNFASLKNGGYLFFTPNRDTDLSGDNLPDIVLQNSADRRIAIVSPANLRCVRSYTTTPTLPANWRVAGVGDFDANYRNEIVTQNTADGRISVLFLEGNRVASSRSLVPGTLPANWEVAAAADLDGDEYADLIAQNVATGELARLLLNGTTIVNNSPLSQSLNANERVVGLGDFDGDGDHDLAVQNTVTREAFILPLNGLEVGTRVQVLPTLPVNWSIGAVGDYDGDGKPDFLAQNANDRRLARLVVVNNRVVTSATFNPAPLTGWKLVGPR